MLKPDEESDPGSIAGAAEPLPAGGNASSA